MSLLLKKLVLGAALLVLPIHGVAATLTVLLCHGDAQLHALHAVGAPGGATQHGDAPDDGSAGGHSANHLCCHGMACASADFTQPAAPPEFPVRPIAPGVVHDLFVPEQPQRPPLA